MRPRSATGRKWLQNQVIPGSILPPIRFLASPAAAKHAAPLGRGLGEAGKVAHCGFGPDSTFSKHGGTTGHVERLHEARHPAGARERSTGERRAVGCREGKTR